MIVVATENPSSVIADYGKRWSIKTLFGNLRGQGFDLKSTHMTNLDLTNKLMRLLTIAAG
ncbi:MAG: hypothetical protein QS721_08975 [Candidatus Endonucleobacter sp. (ex Gigantidas childressi)]|nr:hypothetical protein [Candidatus Endonucleobacter sp. (ex Gigantidas childressi)]